MELFELNLCKSKRLKLISLAAAVIFFSFAAVAGLAGCKSADTAVAEVESTQISTETPRETVGQTTENITEETTAEASQVTDEIDIITDNINMFSGLELSDKVKNYRPLAIMVQNNPKTRPHSGFIYADIVFELVAEGGITRFVTVFSSYDVDIIGPVRSARIYFAEIARSLDLIYTFWGTYPQAYEAIKNMDVLDANSTAYVNYTSAGWRDPSRSDALEHTAFIDTYGIREDAAKFGYSLEGGQSPMAFKLDAPASQRGDITDISVDF